CVLSLQAAASRLMYSFARDGMIPGHRWLSKVSPATKVPTNALIVACSIPLLICIMIYFGSEQLLSRGQPEGLEASPGSWEVPGSAGCLTNVRRYPSP
ncbi:amino acid permease, partial [Acinetobacter baumannii]|uniref:amino acid permease n=1 Tax=Acinetobacter baumannii TaxID=470 RepID=UPI003393406C